MAGKEGSEVKKKKSIFANVQDLAGLNDRAEILDLSTKNAVDPTFTKKIHSETTSAAPFIHHPTPLFAPSGQTQSLLFDYTLNLCQMVEIAASAQNPARYHGQFSPLLGNPVQSSFIRPFLMNPMAIGCPAPFGSLSPTSPPGGAVLMLSPQPGSVGDSRSPNAPPEARSLPCDSQHKNRPVQTSRDLPDGPATALQLPAHPPSSLSLLGSGKTGGQPRQQAPRFQCPDCSRSYSTFSGLSKHRQFHCTSQLKRQFSCKFCEKHYSSLGALKMHIRTHTLPCKCQMCGKAFSRPWLLQGHLRTHTGEKPFRCGHCGRAFADRSNLRAHLQTHSEIKKYRCKTCQKTFSRMSLLTKHENNGCPGLII